MLYWPGFFGAFVMSKGGPCPLSVQYMSRDCLYNVSILGVNFTNCASQLTNTKKWFKKKTFVGTTSPPNLIFFQNIL